jgi:hypothetical protein
MPYITNRTPATVPAMSMTKTKCRPFMLGKLNSPDNMTSAVKLRVALILQSEHQIDLNRRRPPSF